MTTDDNLTNNNLDPPQMSEEVRDFLFNELSRYSAQELAMYFTYGPEVAHVRRRSCYLPGEVDNRTGLVHNYLLSTPESFRAEFRTHLDDEVQGEDEAEEIIFV
ncbi:MAG: hypothetical protein AABX91_02215 [Nanoarchaeota archaeon]